MRVAACVVEGSLGDEASFQLVLKGVWVDVGVLSDFCVPTFDEGAEVVVVQSGDEIDDQFMSGEGGGWVQFFEASVDVLQEM